MCLALNLDNIFLASSLPLMQSTLCTILNSTAISCITPPLNRIRADDTNGVNYTIRVDDAPGPNLTNVSLQIRVLPNPEKFVLIDTEYSINSGTVIRIIVSFCLGRGGCAFIGLAGPGMALPYFISLRFVG